MSGFIDMTKHKGESYDADSRDVIVGTFYESDGDVFSDGHLVIKWSHGRAYISTILAHNASAAIKCPAVFNIISKKPEITRQALMSSLEQKGYEDVTVKYRVVDMF